MNGRWTACTGLMVQRVTTVAWRQKGREPGETEGKSSEIDGVKEHGVQSDNSNKSELCGPTLFPAISLHPTPIPSRHAFKTWNLCWQLNLLTFVTRLSLPPGVGHHWREEVTRPRRWKVDSDDAFQMWRNKMEGGYCSGSNIFLQVKESQIVFFWPSTTNVSCWNKEIVTRTYTDKGQSIWTIPDIQWK